MNILKETTAAGTGFFSISALSPSGAIMDTFHHAMLSIMPGLSQGAVDEIAKLVVAFGITIASRFVMKLFDKKKEVPQPAAAPGPVVTPAPPPETLTLNTNKNGEISQEVNSNQG